MKSHSWKFFRFFILFFICTTFLICALPNRSYTQMDNWLDLPSWPNNYLTEWPRSSQGIDQVWPSYQQLFPESLLLTTPSPEPFQMLLPLDLQQEAWKPLWEEPLWEQGLNMEMNTQIAQPVITEYSRSIYERSDLYALPGRLRNMLFNFAYQIPGQNPIPGVDVWPPSPTSPTPITPKKSFPVPDYWATYSNPRPKQFPTPKVWQTWGSDIIFYGGYGSGLGGLSGVNYSGLNYGAPTGLSGNYGMPQG